ncbi:MAG: hypothetical protein HY791_01605 [Deltaproteobacteria bacterium]|nr:hypothetical protein [Deltaproteobacteria bacterium]
MSRSVESFGWPVSRSLPRAIPFFVALIWSGCARPGADEVLVAYARALERGDLALALSLSSTAADPTPWLGRPNRVGTISAELSGRIVMMALENEQWRVRERPIRAADSPLEVMERLFEAVEARCSGRGGAGLLGELIARTEASEAELDELVRGQCARFRLAEERTRTKREVESEGDRAELRYGSMLSVRWVREDGRWKILDID